jgi:type I restriction enzyme, S subunit
MQESSIPSDDSMPVLKITNTRPDGTLDTTERAFVAGLPSSTMLLTESSLVMIRTNGNRDRIGNIYRANSVVVGCAVSAFQIVINPRDPADTEYIYYFLLGEPVQATISSLDISRVAR